MRMNAGTDMSRYAKKLGEALDGAVSAVLSQPGESRPALLYSAGVDSALLARVCQDMGHSPLLLSIGTRDSHDRRFVERSRTDLGLPVRIVTVTRDAVAQALPVAEELLQDLGIHPALEKLRLIHLSLIVGIYLACRAAQQEAIALLLTGEGADALFAGFDRYQRVDGQDLAATLRRDTQNALRVGLARDRAAAALFSIQLAAPYLTQDVMELATEIPISLKLGPDGNKLVLRELARQRGVPRFIAQRPKKSLQYSTGIWQILRGLQGGGDRHTI